MLGKRDIYDDKQWQEYVDTCEGKGSEEYIELVNKIFEKTKEKLGY